MNRRFVRAAQAALGLGLLAAACSTSENHVTPADSNGSPPIRNTGTSKTAFIDVAPQSTMTVALHGGLGPVLEGQTVTRAMVTIEDVELVSDSGASVVVVPDAVTVDLLSTCDRLQNLIDKFALEAGRFSALRFKLRSAFVETTDDQGATRVFASDAIDRSQVASASTTSHLDLSGFDPNGFVTVAIPDAGVSLQGDSTLAMHFALSESLSSSTSDAMVLSPRVWCENANTFSSVDIQFHASDESFAQVSSHGFQVMLLDAASRPLCAAPIAELQSTFFDASFRSVEAFEGPFVAVLVPSSGFLLDAEVATSFSVQESAHVETQIAVSSVQEVSRTDNQVVLSVKTSSQAKVVQSSNRQVTSQQMVTVGSIDAVAPHKATQAPVKPGEKQLPPAPTPVIKGVPGPSGAPMLDAGLDAGAPSPPPPSDAGMPPSKDAGPPPAQPSDAGTPSPSKDAGAHPPPQPSDAGTPPVSHDAGAPPPPIPPRKTGTEPQPPVRHAGTHERS